MNAENIDSFDIVFLLPFQTDLIPNKEIDLAMNNSSLQEMDLITVNNYIKLLEIAAHLLALCTHAHYAII